MQTRSATPPHTLLTGPWVIAARVAWVFMVILTTVTFAASLPFDLDAARRLFRGSSAGVITAAELYSLFLNLFMAVVFVSSSALIYWRKSNDWLAWIVSMALMTGWTFVSPAYNALPQHHPEWLWPTRLVLVVAGMSVLLFWWLFPDGRFVPTWTKKLVFALGAWLIAFILFPATLFNPEEWSPLVRGLVSFALRARPEMLNESLGMMRVAGLGLMFMLAAAFNLGAQVYRFAAVSTPLQRQQTKWVVFGLAWLLTTQVVFLLVDTLFPALARNNIYNMARYTLFALALLGFPFSIVFSILHYRLWDIDVLIQRALLYGILTALLGAIYLGSVLGVQALVRAVAGPQTEIVIALTTLLTAALIDPLRRRVQTFVDRRFYRERINVQQAFTSFGREIRAVLDLPELLRVLVRRMSALLHISHGAVYVRGGDNAEFHLAESYRLPPAECERLGLTPPHLRPGEALPLTPDDLARLSKGQVTPLPASAPFRLLAPLTAPNDQTLLGVLALGPRLSEQEYSRDDHTLIAGLADQAGTALYVAQLVAAQRADAERHEAEERAREAHRRSPLGRAETLATDLAARPANALPALHALTQRAGEDPETAAVLGPLPRVLEERGQPWLAQMAAGYAYLFASQETPELLGAGVRNLLTALQDPQSASLPYQMWACGIYDFIQKALEVTAIADIADLRLPQDYRMPVNPDDLGFLLPLGKGLLELHPAILALRAYERVDAPPDKLAYLVSAVERLNTANHTLRASLGRADRAMTLRLIENWLTIITRAMGELQTRAQLQARLLTRHTWLGDVVTLALELRNTGRGAASEVRVQLAESPDYTALESHATLERLGPGDEAQTQLRARLHLPAGVTQFRARFIITFTDPRGPDQVENYADAVSLLTVEHAFTFIPNPYVVGTPLQPGSPLFFGREDVIQFIEDNLAAAHRNNLVLIGQRRTGKTSLLKQLAVRLGEAYVPVYMDGQTLGLDPGLPNFFLNLSTEIAFALQDRGFAVEPPDLSDLTASPASYFERQFLGQVRQAIGDRHLLILFDEFEELESAVRRGSLDPSIFGFLRHLIQHSANLSVIFCGTHRLEELATDYWNVLFNISLYRHIAYLEEAEARRLITEPVAAFGMRYDDLALDKMWRVTAGHPYFLQLLCHSLVNRHNQTRRNYLTVAEVNAALDDILASGEAHFMYLWNESTPTERLALTALSRAMPLTGHATPALITDYLAQRGVNIDRSALVAALHRLTLRDVLRNTRHDEATGADAYGWKLGLLGLWVEKYKSLSRVVDEI